MPKKDFRYNKPNSIYGYSQKMKKRKTLPILLKEQTILLIGGGKAALQKAQVLSQNDISFSIVAKTIHQDIKKLCKDIKIKPFKCKDIKNRHIIIDATGNEKVSRKLIAYKKKHSILLNIVDKPKLCDFYFMALTKNRTLQIAVSSSGASPSMAQYYRDVCEHLIPDDIEAFIEKLQLQRDIGIIKPKKTKKSLKKMQAKAYLVGCGLGDPQLLTRKAYNIIKSVDVVLYDHLISKEIMAEIDAHTLRIFVGKEKGFHSKPQMEINKLIRYYIKKGKSVARLKSGDPFIFGRGAEELLYLNKKGIPVEVIPGISSAIAAPLMANIPITAREYSDAFTVVSAHLKGNALNLSWIPMIKNKDHTLIVLMGLSRVNEIVQEAKKQGIEGSTLCAIVSNASRKNQHNIVTTIKGLNKAAVKVQRPAIIIFGNVVKYYTILEKSRQS